MHRQFVFKSQFFRYKLMHQKVQIHSVFLTHKKKRFVNLSLRGNKVSMFTYKYPHKCLRKISKAIYNYRLIAHFIFLALCLISWFPIRNKYSHTWHGKTLPADGCFLYNFTDFIFPKNNCMSIRVYKVSMFAHIDTHTNPQGILV